jgi:hypothetical protein
MGEARPLQRARGKSMQPSIDLAARLLRFEQQLQAYQKLHGDELAELWRALDECKRELTEALPPQAAAAADKALFQEE